MKLPQMLVDSINCRCFLIAVLIGVGGFFVSVPPARALDADLDALLELDLESLFDLKIVTASRVEEQAMLAPATVYVVTAEQIERLGLRDLRDVLALVPGVDVINPHFFLLGGQRGFMGTFSQTLILVNGREMNNLIAGETFIANQFRTHNIRQVEIISGPGSALYGANAVAGVINIITKTADDVDGFEVSVMAGPYETREVSMVFGVKTNGFHIHGSVGFYQSDGEDFSAFLSDPSRASPLAENNPYRRLPDTFGYRNQSRAFPLSLYIENQGFYAGLEYYYNEMGRGTSGIQWDYTQGEDVRELMMTFIGYQHEDLWSDRLDMRIEYRHYRERFWGNHTEGEGPLENPFTDEFLTDNITDADIGAYRGFYSNKRSSGSTKHAVRYENTLRLGARNVLVAGIDYEYSDVVGAAWSRTEGPHPAITEEQRWPEFSNYKWGVYVQDQQRFLDDQLIVTAGLRYDEHQQYGGTWNPRGGLVYRPVEPTILRLLYGESFREPTVFELRNSTSIKPMTMRTYEAGWQQFLGKHLKNSAVFFYNEAQDVIVADSTEEGGISNKGELTAYGFENELSLNVGRFRGFANYTYTTSDLDEPDYGKNRVPDIPRHKANLGLMVDLPQDWSLGLVTRYRGRVRTEYYGQLWTVDEYVTVDATLSWRQVPWFDAPARLDLILKNLSGTSYYDPEPRSPSVVKHPQESFGAFVRLNVSL